MPKLSHEVLVQLVRHAPALVSELLWPSESPASPIVVSAAEFVDLNFAEHRADAVLALGGVPERPDEALVVEVQVERDPRKRWTWPLYLAGLRTRLRCPVSLVVVALDRDVARWCAEPIDLGRQRSIIRPWVLGPETVPVIADLARARAQPELAVLSVAAHADEPGVEQLAYVALQAARELDDDRDLIYPEFIMTVLNAASRAALRDLLHRDDWAPESREYRLLGRAAERHGQAKILLKLLELKGFELSEAQRQRVLDCEDEAQFELWAARVLVATRLDQVLTD